MAHPKKPTEWAFDRSKIDPKWDWFWRDAVLVVPFWEAQQGTFGSGAVAPMDLVSGQRLTPKSAGSWGVTTEGTKGESEATGDGWTTGSRMDDDVFKTGNAASWLVISQKTDATERESGLFGVSTVDAERNSAHAPWTDGTVYWDFGGTLIGTSRNRIVDAFVDGRNYLGLLRWGFTAGPDGMYSMRNGRYGTTYYDHEVPNAITRTLSSTEPVHIGGFDSANADLVEYYFVAAFNAQITIEQVRQWNADPYGPITAVSNLSFTTTPRVTTGGIIRDRWAD